MHKKHLLLILAIFADLGAYLFCLSAKWQIQLNSESWGRVCFSSLNFHFDNVLLAMCYTQLSESIPENITHRSHPAIQKDCPFCPSGQDIFSQILSKKLLQNSFTPHYQRLNFFRFSWRRL